MFRKLISIVLTSTFFWGCSGMPKSPAEKVSKDFIQSYYVEADLNRSVGLTDGLAKEKVQSSLSLREGQAIDHSTHQPLISYKLLESRVGSDEAEFLYEMEIKSSQMEPRRQKTRIKVRDREGVWVVTQFSDYNL